MTPTHTTHDMKYCFGSAIKMLDDNRIGGYLVSFTDETTRDLDGDYFSKATDLSTPHSLVGMPVIFHHGLNGRMVDTPIGEIKTAKVDDHGLWVEAILKERADYEKFVQQWYADKDAPLTVDDYAKAVGFIKSLVQSNKAGWSSGANPNTVRFTRDGFIKKWAIYEASVTHRPAEPERTQLHTLKSIADLLTTEPIERNQDAKEVGESIQADLRDLRGDVTQLSDEIDTIKDSLMETEKTPIVELAESQIKAITDGIVAQVRNAQVEGLDNSDLQSIETDLATKATEIATQDDADEPITAKALIEALTVALPSMIQKAFDAKADLDNQVNNAVSTALGSVKGKSKVGGGSHTPVPNVQVKSRFDHWSAEDFSFALDIDRQIKAKGQDGGIGVKFDQAFMKEYADKALKSYQQGGLDLSNSAVKSMNAIKTDELMYSTQSGYGDEHVPTVWREDIWRVARRDNVIAPLINIVEMPSNPHILPVEGSDPTVTLVPESNDASELDPSASPITPSKAGTTNVTLTASKLGLRVPMSTELFEDSVAGAIPLYRAQAQRAMLDAVDHVLANGDTSSSANLNYDGGTAPATSRWLAFDGLFHKAQIDNTDNALDNSASLPTLTKIRTLRFLLNRSKQSVKDLAIITHPEVEAKLLGMDEFLTMDKAGVHATNMTGQIGAIDGIPVFVSNEINMTDADGKITYDGNVVNRGRLMIVHRNSHYVGYRRKITTYLTFHPSADAWVLTSTMRLAFASQDTDSVSVLYNIGI